MRIVWLLAMLSEIFLESLSPSAKGLLGRWDGRSFSPRRRVLRRVPRDGGWNGLAIVVKAVLGAATCPPRSRSVRVPRRLFGRVSWWTLAAH